MRVFANEFHTQHDHYRFGDHLLLLQPQEAEAALLAFGETQAIAPEPPLISAAYSEIEVAIDEKDKTLWMHWQPKGPRSVTLALLNDLNVMQHNIHRLFAEREAHDDPPFLFCAAVSDVQGIFNLGGDLGFFLDNIRRQDRQALIGYAHACVDVVYNNACGFDLPIVTIGIIEGDALGGGLECALSYNVLIAERGAKMGFPEVLFNSFPGMGAFSFLSRKLGPSRAKQIIMSGRIYSAEEFYEMGLIDVLAAKGEAQAAARKFIAENKRRHALLYAMNKVQNKVNMLSKAELREVTEIWVDTVLTLEAPERRRMELLVSAQQRRGSGNTVAAPA